MKFQFFIVKVFDTFYDLTSNLKKIKSYNYNSNGSQFFTTIGGQNKFENQGALFQAFFLNNFNQI